ncbi:DUF4148 domain-containing protein [Acidovorax sp. FG27]|uniref:DUF4148 domain-containing protein n=1 Tax=Acidovorax sp. FG27 TaxID=3133652 RepID=UPI003341D16F
MASFDAALSTGRRLAPRSTLAAAAWLFMLSAGATGALAQQAAPPAGAANAPTTATTATTSTATAGTAVQAAPSAAAGSAPSAPAPLTRAQVIAELECARASGEMEAAMLQSYGLPSTAPVQRPAGGSGCTLPTARR